MAEYLEILDENGIFTGQIGTRKEIHQKGLWHGAVLVAILDDKNRILIQQRSKEKEKYAGKWDVSVAGHMPAGSHGIESTFLEVMEEVGIVIPSGIIVSNFRHIKTFRDQRVVSEDFIENQFYDFYVLLPTKQAISEITIQKEEVADFKWASLHEIKEMAKEGDFHPRDQWIDILSVKLPQMALRPAQQDEVPLP